MIGIFVAVSIHRGGCVSRDCEVARLCSWAWQQGSHGFSCSGGGMGMLVDYAWGHVCEKRASFLEGPPILAFAKTRFQDAE